MPKAYVRARASSVSLCFSARFKGLSLSLHFYIKKESDTYQNGLGYMSDTYPNPYPPVTLSLLIVLINVGRFFL